MDFHAAILLVCGLLFFWLLVYMAGFFLELDRFCSPSRPASPRKRLVRSRIVGPDGEVLWMEERGEQ